MSDSLHRHAEIPADRIAEILLSNAVAEPWLAKKPAPGFGADMTMAEAAKVQGQYAALIAKDPEPIVGYKAGLTNPAVQKHFNYDQPIRGTVYAMMILRAPAKVPAIYGARPVYEADLVRARGDFGYIRVTRSDMSAPSANDYSLAVDSWLKASSAIVSVRRCSVIQRDRQLVHELVVSIDRPSSIPYSAGVADRL